MVFKCLLYKVSDLSRAKSVAVIKDINIGLFSALYVNFGKLRLDLGTLSVCVGVQHVKSWRQVAG